MNPQPDIIAQTVELCDRMLDMQLTAEEHARLEALVLQHPEARRAYVERVHLHSALREARFRDDGTLAEVISFPAASEEGGTKLRSSYARTSWTKRWLPIAAAISILAAGGGGWWLGSNKGAVSLPGIATLVEAKGARWNAGLLPTEVGSSLQTGTLRLASGLATVEFGKGARVTLEGPAELELLNDNGCFLHSGALTAHVPEGAVGFIVETAKARLIDHGTDFGVSTATDGAAQVQVFQGKVELEHHASGERLELNTSEGASIAQDSMQRNDSEEDKTEHVVQSRPARERPRGMAITSAEGRGKARYVWSPGTRNNFSDTLLLLKSARTENFRRKAWLAFDLERVQSREVAEATLTLTFEPTGYGYASLLPDAVFRVYGLTEDALDEWDEYALNWKNAPAQEVDGNGVMLDKVVPLGSFTMPQGVLGGAFALSTPELTTFLNGDKNRLATLIVVRETMETASPGVVHGFAGNRHPVLRPPTLDLILREEVTGNATSAPSVEAE